METFEGDLWFLILFWILDGVKKKNFVSERHDQEFD